MFATIVQKHVQFCGGHRLSTVWMSAVPAAVPRLFQCTRPVQFRPIWSGIFGSLKHRLAAHAKKPPSTSRRTSDNHPTPANGRSLRFQSLRNRYRTMRTNVTDRASALRSKLDPRFLALPFARMRTSISGAFASTSPRRVARRWIIRYMLLHSCQINYSVISR